MNTITYRLTPRDLHAFHAYHHFHSPVMLFMLIGVPILVAFYSVSHLENLPHAHPVVLTIAKLMTGVLIAGASFLLLLVVLTLVALVEMFSKKNKTILADQTLSFSDDSLNIQSPYANTHLKWDIVQRLARTKNYIFIFVSRSSAQIVPRRAFADEHAWNDFYEFCRQKIR